MESKGIEDHHPDLRRVGLSGQVEALPRLLALLGKERQEDARGQVINALANFDNTEVLERLAKNYLKEKDEDCRFYTVKAFAYAQNPEGRRWIKELGMKDKDKGDAAACRICDEDRILPLTVDVTSSLL